MPIDEDRRNKIVHAVRAYIARERISREEFALRTKLGKSTVDKLVTGLFSEKTILQLESQLKLNLTSEMAIEVASDEFGQYPREEVRHYEGDYIFARPSFNEDGAIHAFHMQISWSAPDSALVVREKPIEGKKVLQLGKILIPRASTHMFIMSNESGWLKSLILSQIDVYKKMRGIMLTMGHVYANLYSPVAMPVIMNKHDKVGAAMIGRLEPSAAAYKSFNDDLLAVEEDKFAKWITPKRI